jgi:RNA polymerase sigma-70 factor (ECF subfamily)
MDQTLLPLFEANRPRLRSLAWRLLGSPAEADDAVQEAWLRCSRADAAAIGNPAGWLTTVVSNLCLDQLRARKSRAEVPDDEAPEPAADAMADPQQQAEFAGDVGTALGVVLDTLAPAERVAFVLHDLFEVGFEDIAPIVERSPTAARQLASRARRRVREPRPAGGPAGDDRQRQQAVVSAFLAASRSGDLAGLLALLDPGVLLRVDAATLQASAGRPGAPALAPVLRGAAAVADVFKGRAQGARMALIEGAVGAVFAPGGSLRAAFEFVVEGGRIAEIGLVGDAALLQRLRVDELDAA